MIKFKKIIFGTLSVLIIFSVGLLTPTLFTTAESEILHVQANAILGETTITPEQNSDIIVENTDDVVKLPADDVIRIQTIFVNPPSAILVNKTAKNIYGYNINDTNYYHLRSLAIAMKDTSGRFNIDYNEIEHAITINTGYNYTDFEDISFPTVEDLDNDLHRTNCQLIVNGTTIFVDAYIIKGTTFINLKDLSDDFGYLLNYSYETNTIDINTESSICSDIKDVTYNPVFTYDPFTKVELSLDDINKILSKSSLSNCGEYFYNMQETYGVNVIFAISVAYVESGRGKYPCGSYNYFGMIGKNFSSQEEGINAFGKLMNNKLYYGKSIDSIAPIYCDRAWASSIKSMMNEIWSYI